MWPAGQVKWSWLYSELVTPHLEHCVQCWAPSSRNTRNYWGWSSRGLWKWWGESRKGWGICVCLGWKRLRQDFIGAHRSLKARCLQDGAGVFPVVPSDRREGNEHKRKHRKFHLTIRKNVFHLRVAEHCNKLPREVVKSSFQIFQTWLGMIPTSCCRWTCFGRGCWTRSPQIPLSTNCAVILWIWIWKGFYHSQLPLKLLHLCREQMLSPADIWLKHMAVDLEVRKDINKICMTWNNIIQHYI